MRTDQVFDAGLHVGGERETLPERGEKHVALFGCGRGGENEKMVRRCSLLGLTHCIPSGLRAPPIPRPAHPCFGPRPWFSSRCRASLRPRQSRAAPLHNAAVNVCT